jgi:hypothetical protein
MGKKGRRAGNSKGGPRSEAMQTVPPPVVDPFRASSSPQATETAAAPIEATQAAAAFPAPAVSGDAEQILAPAPLEPPLPQSSAPAEEPSVPPVSDWDSPFFSDPFAEDDFFDPFADAERSARYAMFAASADRRAHLVRYVIGAVAVSSALCLAALTKVALVGLGGAGEGVVDRAAAAMLPPAATERALAASSADPRPVGTERSPDEGGPAEAPTAQAAAGESPSASASIDVASGTLPPSASGDAPAARVAKETQGEHEREAARQREASRSALEGHRLVAAVEAGERSVELDPTDGEAWLILGAAYQERGDATNARRCYRACVAEAKRGPRSECAGMLR